MKRAKCTNRLTTFQSRIAVQLLVINDAVDRFSFSFDLSDKNLQHLIAGFSVLVSLIILIGRIVMFQPINPLSDLRQVIEFTATVIAIIIKSVGWGLFG